ncbi:MAG TPA: GntR family transcriptional regulator [Polyangiaceae bacterium]|nr:GntR family transcriptional regulator [Polyangiaceae bacterium]
MRFQVNPGDELPIYRQIMRQVIDAVAGAQLKPGDKLPSHRELSQELVIAPLTVKKAYDELEREGHIQTLRGQGTFVAEQSRALTASARLDRLRPLAQRLLHEAALLNVELERVQRLIVDESGRLDRTRGANAADKRSK